MPLLLRVTVRWSGGQIGAGFTNMFFTDGVGTPQQTVDAVRTFFSSVTTIGNDIPTGVVLAFPSALDRIDDVTGILINSVSVTPPAALTGAGSGTYAAPAGAVVTWLTAGIIDGHRVTGRTFIVPLAQSALQSNGTLADSFVTTLGTAANALITAAPEFVIWHRPTSLAAADGSPHIVLAAKVNDRVAMLTSRR